MNEYESQFQRIVDGLVIEDHPDMDYSCHLREQVLTVYHQSSFETAPSDSIRPVWRNIMIKTAVAAMILAGAFLAINTLKDMPTPKPNNTGTTQNIGQTTQIQDRELKLAAQFFAAKDVQGLAALLKAGSFETKLAVINYLSNIGTDEALKVLKDYQALSTDPNLVSAIQKAFVPVVSVTNKAQDSTPQKATLNPADPNAAAQKKPLTLAEPNLAQQPPQDIDNDKEEFLGLKVVDSISGKAIEGAKMSLDAWGAKEIKKEQITNVFGRTLFEVGDNKSVDITVRVRVNAKGFVPKYLSWSPQQYGRDVPRQHTVSMTPGVTVGGVVRTREGQPIEGVTVGLSTDWTPEITEFDYLDSRRDFVTTNKDGRWTFEGFPKNVSECRVELKHPDYVNVTQYANVPPVEQLLSQNCILYMQKGLHIAGRVTNQVGEPVAKAVIYEGPDRYNKENKVETDADGKYIFQRCTPGTMYLTIVAKGYAQDMKTIKLDPSVDDADFVLEPGQTLAVRVVDTYGVGIKNAEIEGDAWRSDQWNQPSRSIRCKAKTDAGGRTILEDLPADEIAYSISADHYASLRRHPLTASPNEQVVTLWPKGTLKGKVYDAQTGQLIEIFSFTEGIHWQGQDGPTWQEMNKKEVRNGNYELPFEYHTEGYAVKIEAEGYLTYESQTFYNEGKEVILDIPLSKGAGLCGVVLGPDGTPAKNTDIAVALPSTGANIKNCRFYKDSLRTFAQTDPNGKFCFPPQKASYILVALSEDGIGEVSEQEFLASGVIMLQKWGRVQGTVYSGIKPLAEQEIQLDPENLTTQQKISIRYEYITFSDPNGRFVFEKVRPGKTSVHRLVPIDDRSKRWVNQTPIEVLPGQTVTVKMGGGGRKVTGRLVCPDVAGVDFQTADFTIYPPAQEIDLSQLPKITVPENFLLLSMEELQALTQKMQAEMAPTFQKLAQNYQAIQCAVQTDTKGQFTINDIAAGSYRVEAKFKKPDSKPTEYGNFIAKANFEITVPQAASQEDYDTVIDVGQFDVKPTASLKIGKPLPEIRATGLDGKPISMDKFRGKYLIVDIGASMSLTETRDARIEAMKTLYNTYKQTQQLVIVSMSISSGMDIIDKESVLKAYRYYAAQKEIPWLICIEITDIIPNASERYVYNGSIAHYILVDPQGVVIAIPKDEEQLNEKINQLLGPQ